MTEVLEKCYEDLARAIVISAADEYKRNRFVVETIDKRSYKDDEGKYRALDLAKKEVKSVELFFHSEWFNQLSNLDGERAFEALQQTYIREYFPMRMEDIRNGKIWFTK